MTTTYANATTLDDALAALRAGSRPLAARVRHKPSDRRAGDRRRRGRPATTR